MRISGTIAIVVMLACDLAVNAEDITYGFTFDQPMSWSDDIVPLGLRKVQKWEIARAGSSGGVLRIAGRDYEMQDTWEVRTLQFNHKPGARARISFDIRGVEVPEGASVLVRHFDGYCTGGAFHHVADEPFSKFPKPIFDSKATPITDQWQHVTLDVGPLERTILTVAFGVRQEPPATKVEPPAFVEYHLDNLKVTTEPLDRLMDPDFGWHGARVNTRHLWASTAGADLDWCTFGDQEDVTDPEGKTIHYTLLQFRDTSSRRDAVKHNFIYNPCDDGLGGRSTITLNRESSAGSCAASWGTRQTVAYSALGLGPAERARIRLAMKMTSFYPVNGVSRVQLGVDPHGGLTTQKATWSEAYEGDYFRDGWHTARLEFDRPADSAAFTIYFRHRDGKASEPKFPLPFPEPQSLGSAWQNSAVADWVVAEILR